MALYAPAYEDEPGAPGHVLIAAADD